MDIRVDEAAEGMRLDRFMASQLPQHSRSALQKLIEGGAVTVDGAVVAKRHRVRAGERIAVSDQTTAELTARPHVRPQQISLDIFYEDDDIIAVNKPAGLVVHPGSGNHDGTLVNGLLYHCTTLSGGSAAGRPGIVHRLDKDTSGVIVAAKNDPAHAHLARQFAEREVDKEYLGVCAGSCPPAHTTIDKPIGRSRRDPTQFCIARRGRPSQTEFWLLAHRSGISALRFRLHTGRTHQIRVHMVSEGLPILGDTTYGGGREAVAKLEPLLRTFAYKALKQCTRQALHAYRLTVRHPRTGASLKLCAPLPDDLSSLFALLEVEPPGDSF